MHKTIIFITHNVEEAVLLSKRVYVMATNPGRVIQEVAIDLPYPRTLDLVTSPEFAAYSAQLTNLIGHVDLSKIK
jgi:NitT/TauT family transport system ATP-binding protein